MRTTITAAVLHDMKPCSDLLDVLRPAIAPCTGFKGSCRGYCKFEPESGHIPRGFGGALGKATEVQLVLVAAEPGDPMDGRNYDGVESEVLTIVSSRCVDIFSNIVCAAMANRRRFTAI